MRSPRSARPALALAIVAAAAIPAAAQPDGDLDAPAPLEGDPTSDDFGAEVVIEAIEVIGNDATSARVIERALPFAAGERMRAGDRRLRLGRYKVLALGFFREVALAMRRGATRGQVVVVVTVVERGTVVLNRLWFGTSTSSVGWVGADVSERNLLGTGVGVGGGAVYAARGGIDGSRGQGAVELRVGAAEVFGSRWGWGLALTGVRGSEPYRIAGATSSDDAGNFAAFDYRRLGARGTATYDVSGFSRVHLGVRVEDVRATLPVAPTRTLPSGEAFGLDLHLAPGASQVVTGSISIDRDTRRDPVLPHEGARLQLLAEGGVRALAGDHHFATLAARLDRWWPVRRGTHAVGLRLAGAASLGDAPRFDRVQLSEVDRMITPRALGLTVSAESAPDFLGTRAEDELGGDLGGSAVVEYVARLFRGGDHLFGGDLFIGLGAWALTSRASPAALGGGVPVDLIIDAGLRLDTEIGVFELTLANALGRVAW